MSVDEDRFELILVGCDGRMGRALHDAVMKDDACMITGRIDREQRELPTNVDQGVVVDFSSESGTKVAINLAHELQTPILVGTTGLSDDAISDLHDLSERVPVAVVANTSLGVMVLQQLVKSIGALLKTSKSVSVELVETHHTGKLDAPSGTSILLANSLAESNFNVPHEAIRSLRTGTVVGTHEIRFTFGNERLTLSHEALDRSLFAEGAINLARLLLHRQPGLYRAEDLLELR